MSSYSKSIHIKVGARSSRLSQAQVKELRELLLESYPNKSIELDPIWINTHGDLDKDTCLTTLDKTDFFTREIDHALLSGKCQIALHSAKDLPDPIPEGLKVVALTKGVDPRDAIVMPDGMTFDTIPFQAVIGSSSLKRQQELHKLRHDFVFKKIRGNVEERIRQLFAGNYDAIIVAQAALIRLDMNDLNRHLLDYHTAPLQGQLAIVARQDDDEMEALFSVLDVRGKYALADRD